MRNGNVKRCCELKHCKQMPSGTSIALVRVGFTDPGRCKIRSARFEQGAIYKESPGRVPASRRLLRAHVAGLADRGQRVAHVALRDGARTARRSAASGA